MTTPARPGSFTGATDNAASGGLFTDTLIDGIPDIVGADVARAETAATNAETSATGAATSATNAATSETNASASATSASTSSANAATSATNAATSASTTAADAATATTKAGEAATSATNAASSETAAAGSATSASSSATSATSSANTAVTSASAAGTSETNAATSATNSANSATASASSASASASSATASANSATASQTAQTAAELAETNAETAETNAETAETGAATSATSAANSASAASTSATNSATSATNSANSATASATSATASATSATAAAASEAAAAGYVDNFDDKYLGAKTSDPTVDNDGDPLTDGALYYNTTDNRMKVYDLGTTTWLLLAPTNAEQININTVANDITNVNTVANNTSNINAVAADATDIGVVATNISNVNTVATNNANVNTVATNITDVNSFADTYFISATAPGSPTTGDLWFDTANSIMKVYDGSGFVNAGSSVNGTSARYNYTATAGQTTFAAVYDTGYVDVYLNGVKLAPADFTATNGSTIVLTSGAALNDTVDIVGYGTFSVASAIALPDNVKATFGDSSDLQIYHDGSNSYVSEQGTGNLLLQGSNQIQLQNNDGTKNFVVGNSGNGWVRLYYNNVEKLETTATGVDVIGTVTADGLTVDTDTLYVDSTNNRVGIVNASPSTPLDVVGTGQFTNTSAGASATAIKLQNLDNTIGSATSLDFAPYGNGTVTDRIEGGHDGSNKFSLRFHTYSSGLAERLRIDGDGKVGIGTASPNAILDVEGANINFASSENGILNVFSNDATFVNRGGSISLGGNSESGSLGFAMIKGAKESTDAGYLAFGTRSAAANSTERLRISSTGNVGIGTTAPSYKLHSQTSVGSDFAGYFYNSAASGNGTSLVARGGGNNSTPNFQVQDYNGNADFTVTGTGDVLGTDFVMTFNPSFPPSGTGTYYQNGALTSTDASLINTLAPCNFKIKELKVYVNSALTSGSATVAILKDGSTTGNLSIGTGTNVHSLTSFLANNSFAASSNNRIGARIILSGTSPAWYHISIRCERI